MTTRAERTAAAATAAGPPRGRVDAALLEAVLFGSGGAVATADLAAGLRWPSDRVIQALGSLRAELEQRGRGIRLHEHSSGWRLLTAAEHVEEVTRFALDGASGRLSAAAVETLAVVAYQQPVTRAHVASVRGVNADAALRTLVTRGLVDVVDREVATGAALYATTPAFLDLAGLSATTELPPLAPLLPDIELLEDPDA